MTATSTPAIARRADTDRVFTHLTSIASTIDLSGISDPFLQWVAANRAIVSQYGDLGGRPSIDGVRFIPVSADGVSAEWAVPESGSTTRRIVWLHGGAWSAGSPDSHRSLTAMLAQISGASVLVPDYRLAPENKFPAGLNDCTKALAWAAVHGPDKDERAETLTLVGDSAGGNLAAATTLQTIAIGGRVPDRLAIIAGTLDNAPNPERVGLDDPICTTETLEVSTVGYLKEGDLATDPRVSPVYASEEALRQFPPTLIQVSSTEALLFDSKRFARRLEDAGIRVNLSIWPGLPHVWHAFLNLLPEAKQAVQEISDFLKV